MRTTRIILAIVGFSISLSAWSDDGDAILDRQCAGCHNLAGPAPATLAELQNRKGPDLFYAGNKYKREWIVEWLQSPSTIRPAGMYYGKHVKLGAKADELDTENVGSHPTLDAGAAKAVAAALMKRKAKSNLINAGEYKTGSIAKSFGEMMFDKFRGCLACHEIEPGYGGLSGPEVYTAAERLQEDYLISFMRDPQAWDPRAFMPGYSLSDGDLQKFVHYFRALAAEGSK